jgi:hypothetical protein
MIQRRQDSRLALEPREAVDVAGERVRKKLQRDVKPSRVSRAR